MSGAVKAKEKERKEGNKLGMKEGRRARQKDKKYGSERESWLRRTETIEGRKGRASADEGTKEETGGKEGIMESLRKEKYKREREGKRKEARQGKTSWLGRPLSCQTM